MEHPVQTPPQPQPDSSRFNKYVNYALTGLPIKLGWRVMLGAAAIPAALIGLGVIFMPESPRWLIMKNRNEQAKRVLLRVSDDPQEAEFRLQDIIKAATEDPKDGGTGGSVWKDLILRPTPPVRRMLISAIGLNFFMQASGNDAVMYYLPAVFNSAGIKNKRKLFGINVIMGLSKASFVLISANFSDIFGRRLLLLIGTTGMAVSLCLLGAGSKVLKHSVKKPLWATVTCIVAVCADVVFLNWAWAYDLGLLVGDIPAETTGPRHWARGFGKPVSKWRCCNELFKCEQEDQFWRSVPHFKCDYCSSLCVYYVCLPETKGKTLEEIHALFDGVKHDDDQN